MLHAILSAKMHRIVQSRHSETVESKNLSVECCVTRDLCIDSLFSTPSLLCPLLRICLLHKISCCQCNGFVMGHCPTTGWCVPLRSVLASGCVFVFSAVCVHSLLEQWPQCAAVDCRRCMYGRQSISHLLAIHFRLYHLIAEGEVYLWGDVGEEWKRREWGRSKWWEGDGGERQACECERAR